MEAGVGIEPAYTALQAAALRFKSIRCKHSTPGSTPGPVTTHVLARMRQGSIQPYSIAATCSQECQIHRPHSPYTAVRNAREEAWLSCLEVILETISVHV
jgi:hypothetical protein